MDELYSSLNLRDVCSRLQISKATAYRWIREGKLEGSRTPNGWRFPVSGFAVNLGETGISRIPPLSVGDLFAGAGGLSLGFDLEGFRSVFFNELDTEAAFTFQQTFPASKPFVYPVQDLSAQSVFLDTGLEKGELDVLLGGPPCQGFSINAPSRSEGDARNHLFREYVRLVLEGIRPKFIVFENVPGLVSHEGGQALQNVCAAFREAGYEPTFRILNACHYGVPQERWRLLIVANRLGISFNFPRPTHFSLARPNFTGGASLTFRYAVRADGERTLFSEALSLQSPVSVDSAIGDLPALKSGGGSDQMEYRARPVTPFQRWARAGSERLFNHHCVDLSEVNHRRMEHVRPGGSWRDIPHDLLPTGMQRARRSDHTRRYGRLDPARVAFTVMTKCDPHWGTVVHYSDDRVISVREAARFQSFPDTFRFFGSKSAQYRQVGNAVPPVLARVIAREIRRLLLARQESSRPQSKNRRRTAMVASGSRRI